MAYFEDRAIRRRRIGRIPPLLVLVVAAWVVPYAFHKLLDAQGQPAWVLAALVITTLVGAVWCFASLVVGRWFPDE